MSRQSRVRAFATGILIVVFSTGAFVSAAVLDADEPRGSIGSVQVKAFGDLKQVDLSIAQRAALDSILEARQPELDSIIRATITDLRQVLDSVDVDVRALLLPDQIEVYEDLRAEGSNVRAIRRTQTRDGSLQVDTIR